MRRTNKMVAAALAALLSLFVGLAAYGGCKASDAAGARADMPTADAELLDYINATWDDHRFAQSLDEVPAEVVMAASEQLEAVKERQKEGPKKTEGDLDALLSSDEDSQSESSEQYS